MSFWSAAVLVVGLWMLFQAWTSHQDQRLGVVRDEDGNPVFPPATEGRSTAELELARRELAELKERVKVLERIATDAHSGDAREQARIAAEIEALRDPPALKREQSE